MSANQKRVLSLLIGGLVSTVAGLAWGLILRGLGDEVIDCVKAGASAFAAGVALTAGVTMAFPFKDDRPGGGLELPAPDGQPAPPSTPRHQGRSRASTG